MSPGKKIAVGIVALAAVVAAVAAISGFRNRKDDAVVRVSGNIEATTVEAAFRISGRVVERPVDEGRTVAAGQILARLDDADLKNEVRMREADVAAADAALREAEAGPRPQEIARGEADALRAQARLDELIAGPRAQEVESARAAVARARAESDRAQKEYNRAAALFAKDAIAARDHDAAVAARDVAAARLAEAGEALRLALEGTRKEEVAQARAAHAQARETLSLLRAGSRREVIDQARARARLARESLALARNRLTYASLVSPIAGVILSKGVEPGEYVSPGTPVVAVADLREVWLRAYVEESDLGRVKPGQAATVTTDTYPGKKYEGRLAFIASEAEFTPKSVQTRKERVRLVYRVKVTVANPATELLPGMPADAVIHTR